MTIGIVDGESATWMTHPGAIYLHEAQQYFVEDLNLEQHIVRLKPIASDYYTEPLRNTSVEVLSRSAQAAVRGGDKTWGELQVTSQVTGFRKRRWYTHENLGEEPLDLPPCELHTTGYWLSLSEETVTRLREAGAWTNDPNDYGPEWNKIRERVRARDGFKCQVCEMPESPSTTVLEIGQGDPAPTNPPLRTTRRLTTYFIPISTIHPPETFLL